MCWRVIQSSRPLHYAIVDDLNVRDSRMHNYPLRWNGRRKCGATASKKSQKPTPTWRSEARRAKAASYMSHSRSSGAAVTASVSTTAFMALTRAVSNQNLSSRSICPSVSSDSCLERHCWNGSHPSRPTMSGLLIRSSWETEIGIEDQGEGDGPGRGSEPRETPKM